MCVDRCAGMPVRPVPVLCQVLCLSYGLYRYGLDLQCRCCAWFDIYRVRRTRDGLTMHLLCTRVSYFTPFGARAAFVLSAQGCLSRHPQSYDSYVSCPQSYDSYVSCRLDGDDGFKIDKSIVDTNRKNSLLCTQHSLVPSLLRANIPWCQHSSVSTLLGVPTLLGAITPWC